MAESVRKRNPSKNNRVLRIVSLFEIPRPQKKGLKRTNSLPAIKPPREVSPPRNSLKEYLKSRGRVRRITEEMDQKTVELSEEIQRSDSELEIAFETACSLEVEEEEVSMDMYSDDTVIGNSDSIETPADPEQDKKQLDWWQNKSFVQINRSTEETTDPESEPNLTSLFSDPLDVEIPSPSLGRRFIKNKSSMRNRSKRRTGILLKPASVKELTKHFEGFKEAADHGETESFRRSFIDEMDREMEQMKLDGFMEEAITFNDLDPFGENVFNDDLDKGMYYLEAYNDDGKELVICSVEINRQSVDLSKFAELKQKSNLISDDDKTLLLLEAEDRLSLAGTESTRTTIYSTTSGDSYDDEGIDTDNASSTYGYNAARRETYCDEQGVVRIERVAPFANEEEELYYNKPNLLYEGDEHEDSVEENIYEAINLEHQMLTSVVKKDTMQYILDEIKSTERTYVADMTKVLREYKVFLEERCPEKVDVVFGNMEQLCGKQRFFLLNLEQATDVMDIVETFMDFEDLLRLYPRYFRNTPRANHAVKELSFLIKEKQERMNDKLDLSAYLLTPLQRLGKYKLFLENIIKQLNKDEKPTGAVEMALDLVKKYMSRGNDAVAIASILHSPLHTKDYGSFITREKFSVLKPRRLESMVFLFEGAIVFTLEDSKNIEQFVYLQSIRTNDLRIATYDDTLIHLTDYTKTKRKTSGKYTYVLDAKSQKLKLYWKQQIEDILWKQMQKIKETTLKEYQSGSKTPNKEPKRREERSKSTGNSHPTLFGASNYFFFK